MIKRLILLCLPVMAQAETDLTALTDAERNALGAEIRQLLLDEPELAKAAFGPDPAQLAGGQYAEDIANDLALLDRLAPQIFPKDEALAVFYDPALMPDLPDQVAQIISSTPALHPMTRDQLTTGLAAELGLDTLPFFITHDTMIRGDMPLALLPRYIDQ